MPQEPDRQDDPTQAESVSSWVETRREAIVALSARLVAAHSVNPVGDTRAVASVAEAALRAEGLDARQQARDPAKPSVTAVIDSGRPGPHLILNCHLDTMPPGDESEWSHSPWELTRTGGRLYGLGMGNMKGSVAAMVHSASLLAEVRDQWVGRITLLAVSDEVIFGSEGAQYLLESDPDLYGDALICGEGAGFGRLSVGEKGVLWLRIDATGELGHSSKARRGEGAIARLATAVAQVDQLNGIRPQLPASLGFLPAPDDDFAFALTANTGTIMGGSFVGQCATNASAEFDFRVPPGLTIDEVQGMVEDIADGIPGLTVTRIKGWDPNWTDLDTRLSAAWMAAATGISGAPTPVSFRQPASDASRWRARGVPALCFGPQPYNSVDVDDFADEDEVLRCAKLFTLAALTYLAP